jgi:hypothetical protein
MLLDGMVNKKIREASRNFTKFTLNFPFVCHIAPLSGVFIVSAVIRRTEVTSDRDC